MQCQYHPDNESVGTCVVCGRAICEEDRTVVQDRYVCSPCFRARRRPVPRRKSPGWAMIWNALPGAGYLYLGLIERAVIAFAVFYILASVDAGGLVVAFFAYILFDAHRQAVRINNDLVDDEAAVDRREKQILGVVLILAGALFLIHNFLPDFFYSLERFWPLVLVLLGAWLLWGGRFKGENLHAADQSGAEDISDPSTVENE